MNGSDIMDAADRLELERPPFKRRQARVSRIGYCELRHVAEAIGEIEPLPFPEFYKVLGHSLERWAFERIKLLYPSAVHQATVYTTAGAESHDDILIPELSHGIEVKTATSAFIRSATAPRPTARDQALLQWHTLGVVREYQLRSVAWVQGSMSTWEVLYVSRGDTQTMEAPCAVRRSFPLTYEPLRAKLLQEKHERTQMNIEMGILPPRPYTRPQTECEDCPLSRRCWGE